MMSALLFIALFTLSYSSLADSYKEECIVRTITTTVTVPYWPKTWDAGDASETSVASWTQDYKSKDSRPSGAHKNDKDERFSTSAHPTSPYGYHANISTTYASTQSTSASQSSRSNTSSSTTSTIADSTSTSSSPSTPLTNVTVGAGRPCSPVYPSDSLSCTPALLGSSGYLPSTGAFLTCGERNGLGSGAVHPLSTPQGCMSYCIHLGSRGGFYDTIRQFCTCVPSYVPSGTTQPSLGFEFNQCDPPPAPVPTPTPICPAKYTGTADPCAAGGDGLLYGDTGYIVRCDQAFPSAQLVQSGITTFAACLDLCDLIPAAEAGQWSPGSGSCVCTEDKSEGLVASAGTEAFVPYDCLP